MRKIKALISVILILTIAFCPARAVFATEGLALKIDAKSAIIIEPVSRKVLFEQNADERLPLASVTKVMTILLIYEALADGRISMDDEVTVSEHAAGMGGSQIFLEPFEKQSVRDLVKSVVIASANDAAVAMAEFISGSEESFVDLMNRKAAELNMRNSSFKNACGLDADGHFSSARDIALMSMELVNNYPEAFEYATTWQDTITHKTARGEEDFGLTNTNKLVKWYNGATGLKTGSTAKALYCLSGTAERDGLKLISVVLGAPNPNLRFQEVMKMFDYGYANYKLTKGAPKGTVVGQAKVYKGIKEEIELVVKDDVSTIVPKSFTGELEQELRVEEGLNAPILAGDFAGEVIYRYNGQEVGRSDIVAVEDVKRAGAKDIMEKLIQDWLD